ncbi:MAG: bifunctional metallophosphatase/5'-nucleotidase [Thermoanaerobaculia bacterium]
MVVVGTTDLHGWFNGHATKDVQYGGVTLLASYVNALRAENENHVLLVDSGDLFQGTLESNYFEGEPVVRAYNELGYSAAAIGNHEFDYGPVGPGVLPRPGEDPLGALKKNAASAKFPFLSANMTEKATGKTPAWAKRYTVVDIEGARIGIIGLSTPDTPNVTILANVATLDFGDPVPATIAAARELRAQGADAVIVIAHMGGDCSDINDVHDVASCDPKPEAMGFLEALPPGTIDAYFGGHTHHEMRQFINGVPAVQGSAYGAEFSALDLWIDRDGHRVDRARTNIRPLTMIGALVYGGTDRCDARSATAGAARTPRTFLGRTIEPDPAMTALLAPYLERVAAKRHEKIGVRVAATFKRGFMMETTVGDLLADAARGAFHADVAFINSGGIRANLPAGDLVYSDVYEVSPFDNFPAIAKMTGAEIAEVLRLTTTSSERGIMQVSGLRYTYDAARDAEKPVIDRNRLVSVTLEDGSPLDPAKVYRVVMPDFLAAGGDGFLPVTRSIRPERMTVLRAKALHDVFVDVLRAYPQPLVPKLDGRITVLNAPEHPPEPQ